MNPPVAARDRILAKLRAAAAQPLPIGDVAAYQREAAPQWTLEEKLLRLVAAMRAVKTEVHLVHDADWPARLARCLADHGVRRLLLALSTPHGRRAAEALAAQPGAPTLSAYDRPIEAWKAELFNDVDAGFTTTRGAIAQTGSLIVWPDADEPRTMSLVPPLHIALAHADHLHATFDEATTTERWADAMPSNALLISGPSKTSDIQQTLAYGAHGPRALVLLMVVPDAIDIAALEASL